MRPHVELSARRIETGGSPSRNKGGLPVPSYAFRATFSGAYASKGSMRFP